MASIYVAFVHSTITRTMIYCVTVLFVAFNKLVNFFGFLSYLQVHYAGLPTTFEKKPENKSKHSIKRKVHMIYK